MATEEKKYSIFVETLKSLYVSRQVELYRIRKMLTDGQITAEEYEYIIK